MKYDIVEGYSVAQMQRFVTDRISNGWEVCGSPCVSNVPRSEKTRYSQAMTRKDEDARQKANEDPEAIRLLRKLANVCALSFAIRDLKYKAGVFLRWYDSNATQIPAKS